MTNYLISPQLLQAEVKYGCHQGEIVDNKDPEMRGRVRVWLYQLYGDFKGRRLSAVPWAKVSQPFANAHAAPDLWDRALVSFDNGNPDVPVVHGYWKANPSGAGTLPHNSVVGTEVPPEAWHHHSLNPEVTVVAKTGEGNAIWMEDKQLNSNNVFSSVQIEDTGGKFFRLRSFFKGQSDYTENSQPDISNDLYKVNLPARTALRDGLSPEVSDPVPGSLELGHQNVRRILVTDDNTYSSDCMVQKNSDGDNDIEVQSINAAIHKIRQAQSVLMMNNSAMFLNGDVHITDMITIPDRYDQ